MLLRADVSLQSYPVKIQLVKFSDFSLLSLDSLWKFGWAKEVYPVLIETTLAAGPLEYSTALELDHKVQEYPFPTALNQFAPEHDATASTESPMAYFERCLATQFRAGVSLYIHRGFFAKALLDHPDNPLRSPYARSFTAAYRGASDMIRSIVLQFDRYFDLNVRWWDFFSTRLFSAAVVVGFIVTRAPACSVAAAAFEEFKQATAVFDRASSFSRRARSGQVSYCSFSAFMLEESCADWLLV
jgi:hypothetical protein